MQNTEYMFVFSKGHPKSVNLIRDHKNKCIGKTKTGHGRRRADGEINMEGNKSRIVPEYSKRDNWWYFPRSPGYKTHPATFPVQLAQDHIISWSEPNDTVLDPFMGSGTTGIACMNTNHNFIGIEIDGQYCQLAQQRIDEHSGRQEV